MAAENARVRYFRRLAKDKSLVDTGWELVSMEGIGDFWEPTDTVTSAGRVGPGKTTTGIAFIDESAGEPFNSNVFFPLQ